MRSTIVKQVNRKPNENSRFVSNSNRSVVQTFKKATYDTNAFSQNNSNLSSNLTPDLSRKVKGIKSNLNIKNKNTNKEFKKYGSMVYVTPQLIKETKQLLPKKVVDLKELSNANIGSIIDNN